ncbi:MAG: multiheme c-type cytochrome [Myxococcales bacterium]|nr:multiheme c-type cytochrome [Myxococcales bacterium]
MKRRPDLFRSCTLLLALWACDSTDDPANGGDADVFMPELTREELKDPETCKDCHPRHYREWRSSMHAYAAQDPVFLAMNRRGQEETGGELGDFCIGCHAPMAVLEGSTTDGLNLDEVPDHEKGITCYFCHNVVDVEGDHNNPLVLAGEDGLGDLTMRGGIDDPVRPAAHDVGYSEWHDRNSPKSSLMCGACHDIVTPAGVHLERTFEEYKESIFADPVGFETCSGCHMAGRRGVAADDPDSMVPSRTIHEHLWAGVDVALDEFPDKEAQRLAVECELANGTRTFSLEPNPLGEFVVTLETNAGHAQPSGAAQDRRMWLEFIAYDADDNILFQSGVVADDEIVDKPVDDPERDPNLWVFRERLFNADGEEVHMFWEAAPSDMYPNGTQGSVLPFTTDFTTPHSVSRTYIVPVLPARVTVQLKMRPMGLDVLDDLIDSGHLDPVIRDAMPTFSMRGTVMEWRQEDGFDPVMSPERNDLRCPDDYLCLLDPDGGYCDDEE